MSGNDRICSEGAGCFVQKAMASLPGRFFDPRRRWVDGSSSDRHPHSMQSAQTLDPASVSIAGLAAKLVVEVCDVKGTRKFRPQFQQPAKQRHAVCTARQPDEQRRTRLAAFQTATQFGQESVRTR